MIGSLEELEKEIETFQNNMSSTGEVVGLLKQTVEQIQAQNESFIRNSNDIVGRVEQLPGIITNTNAQVKMEMDGMLKESSNVFAKEQEKYIDIVQKAQEEIIAAEEKLEVSFDDFIEILKKVNISNLYKQNIQLNKGLNTKIIILGIISVLSLIVSIVGLFI